MKPLASVGSRLSRLASAALGRPSTSASPAQAPQPVKPLHPAGPDGIVPTEQAYAVFSNKNLPSDFSINLGAAPCNHSCLFCPQSVHKPRKANWMSMDILRKVLSEMPETTMRLHISSYSETLSAPNLVEAVRLIKEVRPQLPLTMATNGSLFKEDVIRAVIGAGLNHYSYSFDAPDRESYKRLMQVDHFDRVWDNLHKIIAIKKELGARTSITTHIMGFEEFREAYKDFEAYWKDKVDLVYWRPVSNWGGEAWGLSESLASAGFTLPPEEKTPERYPCTSIFMHFKVQHDGRYAPCVAAVPDFIPEEERHKVQYIGSASDMTFFEAWEKLGEMRRAHIDGEWDKLDACRTCSIWRAWPNLWENRGSEAEPRYVVPGIDTAG